MIRRVPQFILSTYQDAQREQREHLSKSEGFDWEPAAVLLIAALALTWRYYYYTAPSFFDSLALVAPNLKAWASASENVELARLIDWTAAQTVAFLLAPLLCCLVLWRSPKRYALKLGDLTAGWRFYLPMYFLILPALFLVAQTDTFQGNYPFYRLRPDEPWWPRFVVWELFYAFQFLTLEFFFRGFMVHGLKRSCGFYAVFIMTVPYCMIHFGKPPLETVAAIIAGVAMGTMSLGTRSIWMGAALHIAVAWSMDAAALWMANH